MEDLIDYWKFSEKNCSKKNKDKCPSWINEAIQYKEIELWQIGHGKNLNLWIQHRHIDMFDVPILYGEINTKEYGKIKIHENDYIVKCNDIFTVFDNTEIHDLKKLLLNFDSIFKYPELINVANKITLMEAFAD